MHKDFKNEAKHLQNTCSCMKDIIEHLRNETTKLQTKVDELKKEAKGVFSNDMVINLELLQAKLKKLYMLEKAITKPYFGRIDFQELMKEEPEIFYIGKTSVEKNDKMMVLDWRAPISGLYYSGEIGEVMYQAPGGAFIGDLTLKRQYEINDSKLMNVFDKGITPMDEYLFSALSEKKDNRLKDIVTTIQGEQNDIIRAEKDSTLIVQGSAGSGKTTIVLHRIAYLLYTYQDILTANNILVIVPNTLFLNYISDVLPDLGVTDINQTTYQKLIETQMGKKYTIIPNEQKLLKMLDYTNLTKEDRETIELASKFRGSLTMKQIIDDYIKSILPSFVPDEDLKIDEYIVFSSKEIKSMFYKEFSYLPLLPRIDRINSYMKASLKERIQNISSKIDLIYSKKVKEIKRNVTEVEDREKTLIEIYNERDSKIEDVKIKSKKCIKEYFDKWQKIDIEKVYKSLITDEDLLKKYTSDYKEIASYCKNLFTTDKYEIEDLTPLMYLYFELISSTIRQYRHIVIDEAQDYSPFQMYVIKKLNISNSFTIVGDISQGIHSYRGINNWSELMKDVFEEKYLNYLSLKKCYRSTIEIMDFANSVLDKYPTRDIVLSEPVLRHGDKPEISGYKNINNMIDSIENTIKALTKKGNKSIAIICKSSKESKFVYNELINRGVKVSLLTDKDTEYSGGILVMPVHLAKGLEFDSVLIYNCSNKNYPKDNICIKLLYVAITRALHNVYVYYTDEISELIR